MHLEVLTGAMGEMGTALENLASVGRGACILTLIMAICSSSIDQQYVSSWIAHYWRNIAFRPNRTCKREPKILWVHSRIFRIFLCPTFST